MLGQLEGNFSAPLVESVANVLDDDRDHLALRIQRVADGIGIHKIKILREKSIFSLHIAQALGVSELDAYLARGAGDAALIVLTGTPCGACASISSRPSGTMSMRWREGDSEMRRYAPYCFRVETCNKLRDIERFADQLLTATR